MDKHEKHVNHRRDNNRDKDRDDDMDQGGYEKDGERGEGRGGRRSFGRRKVCRFCADTEYVMDYKDTRMMQFFVMEFGKIVPRRMTGTCAGHQRKLTTALKRARHLALIGFVASGGQPSQPESYR